MSLDVSTLFAVTILTSAVAGCLLLLSWLQSREVMALAYWGAGFLLGSLATGLLTARGAIDDFWSIDVGNAVLAAAYGVIWRGVRVFNGRRAPMWSALAGAGLWIVVSQFEPLSTLPRLRVTVMAIIVVTYSLMAAVDFWHARSESLISRWPVIVLLVTHAAMYMTRIPFAGTLPWPLPESTGDISPWFTVLVFETILHVFCVAYLFGSLARERIVLWYKRASLVDPLTEVANRRAFMVNGERILRRARSDEHQVALLAFDIDRFKAINDTYGHAMGDRVLIAFCRVVVASLRPHDFLGRIGGEEFACVLPRTSFGEAKAVAERLRREFAAVAFQAGERTLSATVSIGVAMLDSDLASGLAAADAALYRAKIGGRNRVEADEAHAAIPAAALAAP